jgi:ABC-2 type transport system permease protein
MLRKNSKLIVSIICILVVLLLSYHSNFRLDFTQDKRFTIAETTKKVVEGIKEPIYIKVYLTGSDLPGGFKRLQTIIKQTLADISIVSNKKITYGFVDIYDDIKTETERNQLIAKLAQKGVNPTNVYSSQNGKKTQNLVLPAAVLISNNKEIVLNLLNGKRMGTSEEILNQSGENLEYELTKAIQRLERNTKKSIGFFVNKSTQVPQKQQELLKLLSADYQLYPVDIEASATLQGLDAVFLHNINIPFSDNELYKIDQFIMGGGAMIVYNNAVKVDTVSAEGNFVSPQVTGVENLLFKYGVRVNHNLVKDYQLSAAIPLAVGNMGQAANIQLVPWPYYPLLKHASAKHIVKNIDAVYSQYTSTLDTVKVANVIKTPLLCTSAYTQIMQAPAAVSYNMASNNFDPQKNSNGVKNIAYLLEGQFESYYANSIAPTDTRYQAMKKQSTITKILVCADADIASNEVDRKTNQTTAMGYDRFSGATFENQSFIKNTTDYILNPTEALVIPNKTLKLRALDKIEIAENSTFWQILNLLLPLGIVLAIWGSSFLLLRKKYL